MAWAHSEQVLCKWLLLALLSSSSSFARNTICIVQIVDTYFQIPFKDFDSNSYYLIPYMYLFYLPQQT